VARPATRGRAPEGCPSTEPLDAHVFGVSSEQDVMYAHIVDVGQGNAALLEFPCGAMLIDAGGQNDATTERLLDYLDEFFARRDDLRNTLEGIIITHNHVDHTRALREVVERFNVLRVIENGARGKSRDMGDTDVKWVNTRADETGSPQVTDVDDAQIDGQSGYTDNKIDPLQCPGTDPLITIMSADIAANPGWPRRDFVDKNNHSVVVRVDYGAASLLFTGDLEEPAIETMVDFYDGTSALDVDVYHVGHHGSHNGTTESLMRAMSPRLALISMSEWSDHDAWTAWEYGHPREEAVDLLKENVSCFRVAKNVRVAQDQRAFESQNMRRAIYATGWDGTIVVRATAQAEYTVETSE
jgi:beta-lactamase superfamily II metal-dependent hydrolase